MTLITSPFVTCLAVLPWTTPKYCNMNMTFLNMDLASFPLSFLLFWALRFTLHYFLSLTP